MRMLQGAAFMALMIGAAGVTGPEGGDTARRRSAGCGVADRFAGGHDSGRIEKGRSKRWKKSLSLTRDSTGI